MFETHFLIHTSQAEKTSEAGRGRVFTVSIEQRAGSQREDHWDLGKCTNKGIMRLPLPCWESQGTNYSEETASISC